MPAVAQGGPGRRAAVMTAGRRRPPAPQVGWLVRRTAVRRG